METDTKKAADMLSDLAMKGHPYAQVLSVWGVVVWDVMVVVWDVMVCGVWTHCYVLCVVHTGRDVLQWQWSGAVLPEGIHTVQGMENRMGWGELERERWAR